jgi:hypothetical protein
MNDYIKITFNEITQDQKDLLVAHLNDMGFDGFEEGKNWLICYSSNESFVPSVRHFIRKKRIHDSIL